MIIYFTILPSLKLLNFVYLSYLYIYHQQQPECSNFQNPEGQLNWCKELGGVSQWSPVKVPLKPLKVYLTINLRLHGITRSACKRDWTSMVIKIKKCPDFQKLYIDQDNVFIKIAMLARWLVRKSFCIRASVQAQVQHESLEVGEDPALVELVQPSPSQFNTVLIKNQTDQPEKTDRTNPLTLFGQPVWPRFPYIGPLNHPQRTARTEQCPRCCFTSACPPIRQINF